MASSYKSTSYGPWYKESAADPFRRENPNITPYAILTTSIVIFIIIILSSICHCLYRHARQRRLWSNTQANPSHPILPTVSPVPQDVVGTGNIDGQTSVRNNDVPPDYTVVVLQKTMAANTNDNLNRYPKVAEGKKLETPPPAYITVAPFK